MSANEEKSTLGPAMLLLMWLTGEGDVAAVYGLLASLVRSIAPIIHPRVAAALATSLPILVPADGAWQVGAIVRAAWPREWISKAPSEERVEILERAVTEALTASGLVFSKLDEAALQTAAASFEQQLRTLVARLESHLPESDAAAVHLAPQTSAHADG